MLLPALFCALFPTAASAQWAVDLAVGRAVYDPVAERIGAVNASLGVRHDAPGSWLGLSNRWLYLSGGTDLEARGPLWGAGGTGARLGLLQRGGWGVGVTLAGHLYGYSESEYVTGESARPVVEPSDWGVTLEAIPSLTLRRPELEVELRSGVLETMGPGDDGFLAVTALDAGADVAVKPAPGLRVGATGRYMRFPEGGYPYLGGTVHLTRGRGAVWGFGGRWMSDVLVDPRTGYGVGASFTPVRGTQVAALWQQETSDPLYLSAPRETWSLRLTRRLGRAPAPLEVVVPPAPTEAGVAIRLPLSAAEEAPSVLGDFTGWEPVPMVRVGDFWQVRLPIPSGVHHYGFRTAAGVWFVPESLPSTDDGMGGRSAVLVVP